MFISGRPINKQVVWIKSLPVYATLLLELLLLLPMVVVFLINIIIILSLCIYKCIYIYCHYYTCIVVIVLFHIIIPLSATCSTLIWTPPGTSSFWAFQHSAAWCCPPGSTLTPASSTQVWVFYLRLRCIPQVMQSVCRHWQSSNNFWWCTSAEVETFYWDF